MTVPFTHQNTTKLHEQYAQNLSFDSTFNVLAVEMLGFDGTNLQRVQTDSNGLVKIDPTNLDTRYVLKVGDTMTGPLTINNTSASSALTVTTNSNTGNGIYLESTATTLSADTMRIKSSLGARALFIEQDSDAPALNIDATGAPHTSSVNGAQTVFNIDGANVHYSMVKFTNNGISTDNNGALFVQNLQSTTESKVIAINQVGRGAGLFVNSASLKTPAVYVETSKYAYRGILSASGGYGLYLSTSSSAIKLSPGSGLAYFSVTNPSETSNVVNISNLGIGSGLSITQTGDGKSIDITSSATTNVNINSRGKYGMRHVVDTAGGYGISIETNGEVATSPSGGLMRLLNMTTSDSSNLLNLIYAGTGKVISITDGVSEHASIDKTGKATFDNLTLSNSGATMTKGITFGADSYLWRSGATSLSTNTGLSIGGSFSTPVVTKTSDYTALTADSTILVDATGGAVAVTLPPATGITGRMYTVKKTDSSVNAVTVSPGTLAASGTPLGMLLVLTGVGGTQSIDGSGSYSLATQNKSATFQSDGQNWYVIAAV